MTRSTIQTISNTYVPDVTTSARGASETPSRTVANVAVQLPEAAATLPTDPMALPRTRDQLTPEEALNQLEKGLEQLKGAEGNFDVYLSDYSEILRYIGSVLIKNADAMRQNALSDRMAAREAARGALLGQADKLHEAAEKARMLAIISLVVVVALSVTTIASSAFSLRNSYKEIKLGQQKTKDLDIQQATVKNLKDLRNRVEDPQISERLSGRIAEAERKAESISKNAEAKLSALRQKTRYADAATQMSSAGSNVLRTAEGIQQANIKATEADATLLSAHAQYEQQQSDVKKELYDKVIELVQQSINLYRNMLQSQVEAMRALTRS